MDASKSAVRTEFKEAVEALLSPGAPAYPEHGTGSYITVQQGCKRIAHARVCAHLHILTWITARAKGRSERGRPYSIKEYAYSALVNWMIKAEGANSEFVAKIYLLLLKRPVGSRMLRYALIAQIIEDQDYRTDYMKWLGRRLN